MTTSELRPNTHSAVRPRSPRIYWVQRRNGDWQGMAGALIVWLKLAALSVRERTPVAAILYRRGTSKPLATAALASITAARHWAAEMIERHQSPSPKPHPRDDSGKLVRFEVAVYCDDRAEAVVEAHLRRRLDAEIRRRRIVRAVVVQDFRDKHSLSQVARVWICEGVAA